MRKLVLKMSLSLDGFVGAADKSVAWVFQTYDEEATRWTVDTIGRAGAHLMGRVTYHDMAAYWPTSDEVFAAPMNDIPKIVFSSTAFDPDWPETTVLTGDLATEIAALKQQDGGDLVAHGGAGFARSLIALGLVDEYRLLVHPVALGTGLPIFSDLAEPRTLRTVATTVFGTGATATVHRPI